MSTVAPNPTPVQPAAPAPPEPPVRRRPIKTSLILTSLLIVTIAGIAWASLRAYRTVMPAQTQKVPLTAVKKSDLTFNVTARGELRGGNSEMLTAPIVSGSEMHLTSLRKTGDLVKPNDVVAEFDKTEQNYKLQEAEADVNEAKLKVAQAEAQAIAQTEEDRYALEKAAADVEIAALDVRKNELLSAISARQNDLALQAARDRLAQLQHDQQNRTATNTAAIAVQKAAQNKAEVNAAAALKSIDSLTVRASHAGYISVRQNTSGGFFMDGMTLPIFQVGDSVNGGMAVAEIPDLTNWEVSANIGELDRGHLALNQKVDVHVVALPQKQFTAHVSDLGGTSGPPWNRRFECKMKLDNPSPELRPGMSVRITVTTDTLKDALWLPAQALFESGNRTYVYVPAGAGFTTKDVHLIRRSESRAVISGLQEGQQVALADPQVQSQKKTSGATSALSK